MTPERSGSPPPGLSTSRSAVGTPSARSAWHITGSQEIGLARLTWLATQAAVTARTSAAVRGAALAVGLVVGATACAVLPGRLSRKASDPARARISTRATATLKPPAPPGRLRWQCWPRWGDAGTCGGAGSRGHRPRRYRCRWPELRGCRGRRGYGGPWRALPAAGQPLRPMELRLAQAGLPVLFLKGGGGSLSGHRRRPRHRHGGRSRLGGSVGLFSCLLRRPARSGRGDDREWLRRGFRPCEVRPHGHPSWGWRAGPVARSVPGNSCWSGCCSAEERWVGTSGGPAGAATAGAGRRGLAGAAACGRAATSDGVPAAAAIAPKVAAGTAATASAGAGCTREGSIGRPRYDVRAARERCSRRAPAGAGRLAARRGPRPPAAPRPPAPRRAPAVAPRRRRSRARHVCAAGRTRAALRAG